MRSLIVSTSDIGGGAAIAGYRLHEGLRRLGRESGMLVREKLSADEAVVVWGERSDAEAVWWDALTNDLRLRARTALSTTYFSLPWPGEDVAGHVKVKEAEVIHLHWVGHFVSPEGLRALLQTGRPVIWTLHDERAFTGGCHYAAGCEGFLTGCEACPQLRAEWRAIPERALALSKACSMGVPKPVIVAPSRWLAEEARRSALFAECRVECIPYGLDLEVFKASDKKAARAFFGLPEEALVILIGAQSLAEPRKGFDLVRRAIERVMEDEAMAGAVKAGQVVFAAYGQSGETLRETGLPLVLLGEQATAEAMARVLSASDLFVCPSREDNLPNTVMEAMACGVPVLGANVGGIPDMIVDGRNGRLVAPNDGEALGEALMALIREPGTWKGWGAEARRKCEAEYGLERQARAYAALYDELVAGGIQGAFGEEWASIEETQVALRKACEEGRAKLDEESAERERVKEILGRQEVKLSAKDELKAVEERLRKIRRNPLWFLFGVNRAVKRRRDVLKGEVVAMKAKKAEGKVNAKEEPVAKAEVVEKPRAEVRSEGVGVRGATLIVTAAEINERHGTGVLLERLFGDGAGMIHVRSMNLYGGKTLGALQICLPPGEVAGVDLAGLLKGSEVTRLLSVPYCGGDVENTLALQALTGAPMVVWLMDHHLGDGLHQIPRALMKRLLEGAQLRLGISPEFCELYEREFGFPVHFVPPMVNEALGQRTLLHLPPSAFLPATGVLLGNIWSQRWLKKLAVTVEAAKIPLTAFGHKSPEWVKHGALETSVQFRGFLPEVELVAALRGHAYAVVPTGTMDAEDDLPDIARYSLPSRTLYLSAVGNLPIIVTGDAEAGVAKFVKRHDLGVVVPYEGKALRQAVQWICRPEQQLRFRRRAAAMAPAFACDDGVEWLWKSLEIGRPCDERWSEAVLSASNE